MSNKFFYIFEGSSKGSVKKLLGACGGERLCDGAGQQLAHGARLESCAPARLPPAPPSALARPSYGAGQPTTTQQQAPRL
ncbi:hypothetical protein WA026_021380 [Henosepilachna vigintioctopunctata]|uniref:Uncharacterized protein n=1 Tax=Henosepilachna vigintioctopunctata TaxID=420089 RepID=A0AAW1TNP4_9CUCU